VELGLLMMGAPLTRGARLYTYIFLYVITAGTIMFGPIYYIMGVRCFIS
jgi:hypothetical protein